MSVLKVNKAVELHGHSGAVYTFCEGFEPGMLLSGSVDKMVGSWNALDGTVAPFRVKLDAAVYSLFHHQDNGQLFIGQGHGGIHVIDIQSRTELRLLQWHKKGVFDINGSQEHNLLWSCGGDGTLAIADLDTVTLQRLIPLSDSKIRQARISPDGKLLAVAVGDSSIRILDTTHFNEVYTLDGHQPGANSVCFSPDGKFLLSGGRDAHLRVWNVHEDFKEILAIPGHNFTIYSIVFDPTGKWFATASRDKTIKIWDARSFDVLHRIESKIGGHRNSVNKLLWTEDLGLISAGDDGKLMRWEVE